MNPIENLKTSPSKSYTNVTGKERILFVDPKNAKKGTTPPVNYIELDTISNLVPPGPTGPTGAQGPIGPQGVPGPVGPAGLNWQGAWDATTSYVIDDAVGFGGASWFCIANIAGNPSNDDPSVDTVSWALLAAQGATGPQGPQGIAGTAPVLTTGPIIAVNSPGNPLTFDINNVISGTTGQEVYLPQNAPIGKEIIVSNFAAVGTNGYITVKAFGGTTTIYTNRTSLLVDRYFLYGEDQVRFISLGGNTWRSEYIAGTNIIYNNLRLNSINNYTITDTVINTTTSALTAAQLNTAYNFLTNPIGLKVICKDIVGGGLVYIKTGLTTWVSSPITAVV